MAELYMGPERNEVLPEVAVPYLMCKGCDRQFLATRSDATTCGPTCRQRYKRKCDRITKDADAKAVAVFERVVAESTPRALQCEDCGIERDIGIIFCHVCRSWKARQLF